MGKMKQLLLDTIEASLPEDEQAYVPTFPDTLTSARDEAFAIEIGEVLGTDSE